MEPELSRERIIAKNRLVTKAFGFAAERHSDAFRKGTQLPYILHPAEVAAIAGGLLEENKIKDQVAGPDEVIAAAVLHDTMEDTGTTKTELAKEFGESVADLVAHESEDKREDLPAGSTWRIRKEETVRHLSDCKDIRVKIIAFADKLANLRAMYRDYRNIGDELWKRFNQHDPTAHGWYYGSILNACPELEGTAAYEEYRELIGKNFFHMPEAGAAGGEKGDA